MASEIRGLRVFEGFDCNVQWTPEGQVVSFAPASTWHHPWQVTVHCEPAPDDKPPRWLAEVKAGFVNGEAPVVTMTVGTAPFDTIVREQLKEPPTVDLEDPEAQIDVPLFDRPMFPLSFRPVGTDGPSGDAVPRFFIERGVADPRRSPADQLLAGRINLTENEHPPGTRLLRASEIVLVQPRSALTAYTEIGEATTDYQVIQQTLGIRSAPPGAKLRLRSQQRIPPKNALTPDLFDRLWEEPTEDTLHIATVYLLSPPDTVPDSEPTPDWQVFVKHHVFWNLNYAQSRFENAPPPDPLTLNVPLAGGVAQPLVSSLLAQNNDAFNQALNFLNGRSLAGKFWTV